MKKFLALILSLAMVFALVACGDEKTDDSQNNDGESLQSSEEQYILSLTYYFPICGNTYLYFFFCVQNCQQILFVLPSYIPFLKLEQF